MKKIIALVTILVSLFVLFIIPISAKEVTTEIEYFEDGSYRITEITVEEPILATRVISTKSGSKTDTYYSASGNNLFSLTVRGTFNYNGTVARATASSYSYSINSSSWSFVSGSSSYTANRATAYGTFENSLGSQTDLSVTLYCDQDGNLS